MEADDDVRLYGISINDFVFRPLCSQSSPTGGAHLQSSASALLARLASLLRRFRPDSAEASKLPQPSTYSGLHPRMLFNRLASLIHHSPLENDAQNELQQPSTSSRLDIHALLAPHSQLDEGTEPHPATPPSSRPDTLMDLLSSLFQSQPHASEEIELSQSTMHSHVVEVPAMRDREVYLSLVN
jgi:hypothetical protein